MPNGLRFLGIFFMISLYCNCVTDPYDRILASLDYMNEQTLADT
jgi:hypothetical protein